MLNNYLCEVVLSFWYIFSQKAQKKGKVDLILFLMN